LKPVINGRICWKIRSLPRKVLAGKFFCSLGFARQMNNAVLRLNVERENVEKTPKMSNSSKCRKHFENVEFL
jgi:hypothetical protein